MRWNVIRQRRQIPTMYEVCNIWLYLLLLFPWFLLDRRQVNGLLGDGHTIADSRRNTTNVFLEDDVAAFGKRHLDSIAVFVVRLPEVLFLFLGQGADFKIPPISVPAHV